MISRAISYRISKTTYLLFSSLTVRTNFPFRACAFRIEGCAKSLYSYSSLKVDNFLFTIPFLKHDHFIRVQIAQISLWSFGYNIRVFLHQQPPNIMCKEEPSLCVVQVGVCFGILVVDAMVPRPFKDLILCCHGIKWHDYQPERLCSFA